jgi:hypothetical protein
MAVAQGYGKTVTSGSVFAYDVADTRNSYIGEPTTNINTYTLSDSDTDGSGQGNVGTRTLITNNHVQIVDVNSNTRQTHLISGLTGGTTYTVSIEFKKISGTPTFRFQLQNYLNGTFQNTIKFTNTEEIGIQDIEGWQKASWTFTLGASANGMRIWYQDGADYTTYTHAFELKNPQLEAKSHATPFVAGTRSATQGLLPLVGNSSLDLSNVSFDSNAQMTFDGSDDRILTSQNIALNGSQTFEVITTISGGPQSPAGIISNHDYANTSNFGLNHIGGNRIGISIGYTDDSREYESKYTTYTATVGTPFHLVMTFDQPSNTVKLYINGVLDSTFVLTKTVKFTSRPVVLGRWDYEYNYYYFNGKIPAAKTYNRALSAGEVRQNYLHYKTRFNLS